MLPDAISRPVIEKAIASQPDQRYQTVPELVEAHLVGGQPVERLRYVWDED